MAKLAILISLSIFVAICYPRTIIVAKSDGECSTISDGLNKTMPGDTVLVKTGVYNEFVKWPNSGTPDEYITLKAFGDGPAVISGYGLTITEENASLLLINSKNYVRVIGIDICNNKTTSMKIFNKGIQVEGDARHVIISKCKVYSIENTSTAKYPGANAIGVFGRCKDRAITDIVIDSCEVFNNKTGFSEAVSINGNVDRFSITHCYIHDNNNIGILLAGFYGECDSCGTDDQARHGIISDNRVERCSSCDNPAYKGDCAADGIYSDGGGKSIIERNIVSECDVGIEAGAELAAANDDSMIIRDNLISNCTKGGLFLGGYAKNLGVTVNCLVQNNTLYMNDSRKSGSGELLIQKSHDNIIRNNIFYSSSQKIAVSNAFPCDSCYNNTVDNNLFFSEAGGTDISGVALDSHAKIGDPLFVNNGSDFHLQAKSPAVNACALSCKPAKGELDIEGKMRKCGSAVDIGAYEYGATAVKYRNGTKKANHTVNKIIKR